MLVESPSPTPDDLLALRDLVRTGLVTDALRGLEAALAGETRTDRSVIGLASVLECRLARGELGPARRVGDRLAKHADEPGPGGALASHALGELATARGDHEAAARRHLAAGELLGPGPQDLESVPWRSGAALALARLGRHREAADLSAEHLELARAAGPAYAVAHALRTAAAVNADGSRMRLLREARATLTGVRAERLAAQIGSDLAVVLTLQGGPPDEAVTLLRSAEAYAGREGLVPLQQRIHRMLERLDEQPRRIRSEVLASLTTTEQKAARLAADGLTNREIASHLGVTVKAVEWHLSHVYRKLGIRGRATLPETLGVPA